MRSTCDPGPMHVNTTESQTVINILFIGEHE